jgi:hypothetical protein
MEKGALDLIPMQFGVIAILGNERIVGVLFHNAAFIYHNNAVAVVKTFSCTIKP